MNESSCKEIIVIDYGMGNIHSVTKALAAAGAEVRVTSSASDLAAAKAVVLPGVGHFGDAMNRLNESGMTQPLREWITNRKPFLGICLGLQTLFDRSDESPDIPGLGAYRGSVVKFPAQVNGEKMIVPAMGWNTVHCNGTNRGPDITGKSFYFVHSYYASPADRRIISATTDYGINYTAAIADPPIYATQFHPEKSGEAGIDLLKAWLGSIA